jgi:protein O-mannosyl-transferase
VKNKIKPKHHLSTVKNPPKALQVIEPDRRKIYSALAFIVLISAVAYLPVFHNGLLDWDDEGYIKNNPLIYSINLKEIFSRNLMGNYHPITVLTLALEYHFFGLSTEGYHSVNLILHLLNVLLVFYAVYLISGKAPVALVASLLFGVHPLHVESVAWAAELKDLLYTFFFLASYIFYLKYVKELRIKNEELRIGSNKYYLIALLLFLVSLLSKAMAASLPLVMILTDYFKGRKIDKKTLLEKVPFFLLSIILGVVAILAQKSLGATELTTNFTFPQRIVFASFGYIAYLLKLLVPLNLSAFYPYPAGNIPVWFYAYLLLSLLLAAYVIYSHRFSRKIIFGMGFFTITILLVLQLLPVGDAIMADRYSYIPSIGIFYLAGEGLIWLWSKKLKLAAILLLCVSTVFFSIKTYARCGVWKNDLTLWDNVIDQHKNVYKAYYNRGVYYIKEKRYDEAIDDFNKAIELNPEYAEAYNNRGNVFVNKKRNDEALNDFNMAIKLNAKNASAYYNRGIILAGKNRNGEAIKDFTKAIELKPDYARAYNNRGITYVSDKRNDKAIYDFTKAIELKPDFSEAYNNRGFIFFNEKRNVEAIRDFNKAIELNPGYISAYYNLANLLFEEKRYEGAISVYTKVIAMKGDYVQFYYKRGLAEYYSGNKTAACMDLQQAARFGYKQAEEAFNQMCK